MSVSSLVQQDVLHDVLPQLVVQPQECADDHAGDEDDHGAADHGLLARPLDLLELAVRLADEIDRAAAARALGALARPALRLVAPARSLARRRRRRRRSSRPGEGGLLGATVAPLLTARLGHRLLAGLPVRGVRAAPAAVLLELDAVGRVPLRLLRLVVPPLALGARERDCDSDSGGHCCLSYL